MRFPETELRDLVGRATPLFERTPDQFEPALEDAQPDVVQRRFARWRQTVIGHGAPRRFDRRLEGDHLNESHVRTRLGRVRLRDDQPLPPWSATLNAVLEICAMPGRTHGEPPPINRTSPGSPIPFEDLLEPFVAYAWAEFERRAGATRQRLALTAADALRRQLLSSLSYWSELALGFEFRVFLAVRQPASWLVEPAGELDEPSRECYSAFVGEMRSGTLRDFFWRYPVLARLLATHVEYWIAGATTFCRDLDDDLVAIADVFAEGRPTDRVVGLQVALSDPHNCGRSVAIVEFGGDTSASTWKLVYKPKDLRTDRAFFELLTWLGNRDLPLDAKTLRVLRRDDHGWVEHVEPADCRDRDGASRYFRRAGMLLCLVRALSGTDFHFENIIASGEYPVLIDIETLMYHRDRPWYELEGRESADWVAGTAIADSVFVTGLLPMWMRGGDGRSFDISGLGAVEAQDTGYTRLAWTHPNTDRMTITNRERTVSPRHNAPRLEGKALSADAYRADFLTGFSEMHRCLVTHRDALISANGPLEAFRGAVVRFILRPTLLYVRLADQLRHPDHLADGADRSIEIEALARSIPVDDLASAQRFLRVYAAEREALEGLDVPMFTAWPESSAVCARGAVLDPEFFDGPSLDRVRTRIRALDEDDRRIQTDYISATLHARYPRTPTDGLERAADDRDDLDLVPVSRDVWIEAALDIARHISERAIRGHDDSVTWLTFNFDSMTERQRLEPMADMLYSGRCGVALFLAALARVSGAREYGDLALAALKPVRKALASTGAAGVIRAAGLGGGSGLGGLVYALVRAGHFLEDESLVQEAERLVSGFTQEPIEADRLFDVIAGSAGAILGLLAVADRTQSDAALEWAVACGRHLLARRIASEAGPRVWIVRGAEAPLTGGAHGAAGIALALLRLFGATGDEGFREAAREAIDYEAIVYSDARRNWPDFRTIGVSKTTGPGFRAGWCTGAPGVGLSRIGGLPWLDTPVVRRDIDAAVATTSTLKGHRVDQLCCGNAGCMELFISGASIGLPDLAERADRLAARVRRRARASGFFTLQSGIEDAIFDPSLFRGLSGIGYQFLRLAAPDQVPAVLLWE